MLLVLDTSVVPPLIYAVMGTSREIAIGPVAVVSLLLPSMIQKLQDPGADPIAYTKLVLTATFFTGIFQASFGLFRYHLDCTGLDYTKLYYTVSTKKKKTVLY